jgi:hypothetical protein
MEWPTQPGEVWAGLCRPATAGRAIGEDCSDLGSGRECAAGLACLFVAPGLVCRPYCDPQHPCANGVCTSFDATPPSPVGWCK